MTLAFSYFARYRVVNPADGAAGPWQCRALNGTASTSANGSFDFPLPVPAGGCAPSGNLTLCTTYARPPEGPLVVAPAAGPPAGYDLVVTGTAQDLSLELVYQLAGVTLTPAGPFVSTSVGLPTAIAATVWAADGRPSSLSPQFRWELNGTGWRFDGPSTGDSVEVEAVTGAGVGNLSLHVSAVVDAITLPTVTVSVQLVALGTVIESGELNRTAIDAGESIGVLLTATGAAGLPYSAGVQPGLGLAAVAADCTSVPAGSGSVTVRCNATLTYPATGTAQPTANVTIGGSTGDWRFPAVEVTAAPALSVTPARVAGYALAEVPFTVTAINGSGARPFRSACLDVGGGAPACQTTPGPSWAFAPVFLAPGNYSARVWVVDAGDTNASLAVPITVAAALSVGSIGLPEGNASAAAPFEAAATVAGGVLPLRYWWNVSGLDAPVASGTVSGDGPIATTITAALAGPLALTLTVVDRLGSLARASGVFSVAPAAARTVAPILVPPAGVVAAGTPVALAWGAFVAAGPLDRSFSEPAELTLTSPAGPPRAWVNASGVGPLTDLGGGHYAVPAASWVGGVLNLSLTVANASPTTVALGGPELPGVVPSMTLEIVADRSQVRLFAPAVRDAGARANATLWQIVDRFGNAAPGALLSVDLAFGAVRTSTVVAAIALRGGASGVWVNYSAPADGAGVLTVADAAGAVVLGPIAIPAAPTPSGLKPAVTVAATAIPIGSAGAIAVAAVRRRRRSQSAGIADRELHDLAEGRAQVVALVRRAGAIDLAGVEAGWDPPPAPPALADWLASLVADGTLTATLGEDGRARFCLAEHPRTGPRVTLDVEALERSLRRRDDALGERPPEADD